MKYDLIKELAPHFQWNPDGPEDDLNPHVEVNRRKVNEIFKRHFKELGYEDAFTAASGLTLYQTMKHTPNANLWLYISGKVSVDDLIKFAKEGLMPNDMYKYAYSDIKEFVKDFKEVQREIHAVFEGTISTYKGDMTEVELPDISQRNKINELLSTSSMPFIEDFVHYVKSAGENIEEERKKADAFKAQFDTASKDIETLKKELVKLSSRVDLGPTELTIEHDGTIPEGHMTTKSVKEVFPELELKQDFDLPWFEWEGVHPDVPKEDEHYIFRPKELVRVLMAIVTNKRAYLQGHTGTGKTTLIEQVAARLNFPFVRVNFDSEITRMDLIGRDTLRVDSSGNTISVFEEGILPKAMASPCFFCADEIDFVRPDVAYVLQSALEFNSLRITEDGDRMVKPHPMFRMFATGNTVGQGDEEGMYQGARPQSMALLDRFTIWCRVDYLNKDQRETLIKRHNPTLSTPELKTISSYIDEHLEAFTTGKVLQPISPRGMLAIAHSTVILGDLKEALEMVVIDRASSDDRSTLKGLVDRVTK